MGMADLSGSLESGCVEGEELQWLFEIFDGDGAIIMDT